MRKYDRFKNLIKFHSCLSFIPVAILTLVLTCVTTANAQQLYLGNDGCRYTSNGYERTCPVNNTQYYEEVYKNGRWQRSSLVDESERSVTKVYLFDKQSWFYRDNRTNQFYLSTNLGLMNYYKYLETGEVFIKDKNGRDLVSPTGNPNGPWVDGNKYVNDMIANNGVINDINRNHRNREQKQWEKGFEKQQMDKKYDQKQEDVRREQKRRFGY